MSNNTPDKDFIENCFSIDGRPCSGNKLEYLVCRLKENTPIRYKKKISNNQIFDFEIGTGLFIHS